LDGTHRQNGQYGANGEGDLTDDLVHYGFHTFNAVWQTMEALQVLLGTFISGVRIDSDSKNHRTTLAKT
jgi:hypothetical protein